MSLPLPKLSPPNSRLIVEQSHFNHLNSRHQEIINGHPFNYMLDVIIPNCTESPDLGPLQSSKYYEARVQLSSLIHRAFIEAFIVRGKLQLVSTQRNLDVDDVISVSPKGILTLNLTKDSYQKLGLVGKPSTYCRNSKQQRFVVEIDMKAACFVPGTREYERARECLNTNHTQFYTVVYTWTPSDDSVAAVSIMKYFQSIGYNCKEINVDLTSQVLNSVTSCPVIDPHQLDNGSVNYTELWEWLGAVACNINIRSQEEVDQTGDFIFSYCCPSPSEKVKGVFKETVTGVITISDISSRLKHLRELAATHGWCAMVVHGFADAPTSWQQKEHGYQVDGDNIYVFLVFADSTYWLLYGLGAYDSCP